MVLSVVPESTASKTRVGALAGTSEYAPQSSANAGVAVRPIRTIRWASFSFRRVGLSPGELNSILSDRQVVLLTVLTPENMLWGDSAQHVLCHVARQECPSIALDRRQCQRPRLVRQASNLSSGRIKVPGMAGSERLRNQRHDWQNNQGPLIRRRRNRKPSDGPVATGPSLAICVFE